MKENKSERFRRVAEARTQKIIKMIRLLGNCSRQETYEYTPSQIKRIFVALNRECELSKRRFSDSINNRKRFSLSSCKNDNHAEPEYPTIYLSLPNGQRLRARAIDDKIFPAINIDLLDGEEVELICFAEFNPKRDTGPEVCIGVYQSNQDATVYYKSYQAERDS